MESDLRLQVGNQQVLWLTFSCFKQANTTCFLCVALNFTFQLKRSISVSTPQLHGLESKVSSLHTFHPRQRDFHSVSPSPVKRSRTGIRVWANASVDGVEKLSWLWTCRGGTTSASIFRAAIWMFNHFQLFAGKTHEFFTSWMRDLGGGGWGGVGLSKSKAIR